MINKTKATKYGVGIVDTPPPRGKGSSKELLDCYTVWSRMLERCYSDSLHERFPTYEKCTVCDEWKYLSNFMGWMTTQDYKDKQLDKDILTIGNKIYSPSNCIFVSNDVNSILISCDASRGKYKRGVYSSEGKFRSTIRVYGKSKHLGYYDTENEAYAAYVVAKSNYIREVADMQRPEIKLGLYRHAKALEDTLK